MAWGLAGLAGWVRQLGKERLGSLRRAESAVSAREADRQPQRHDHLRLAAAIALSIQVRRPSLARTCDDAEDLRLQDQLPGGIAALWHRHPSDISIATADFPNPKIGLGSIERSRTVSPKHVLDLEREKCPLGFACSNQRSSNGRNGSCGGAISGGPIEGHSASSRPRQLKPARTVVASLMRPRRAPANCSSA